MRRYPLFALAIACLSPMLIIGCGHSQTGVVDKRPGVGNNEEATLNLFIWSDYLAPDTLSSFEKETGIKVNVAYYDTNETMETRLLTGSSGFDVVVPSGAYFNRQIRSGAYLPLDKTRLPNLANLDPAMTARAALYDPGNAYGVVNIWGTLGIGYNSKMLAESLPDAPSSWRLIFDRAYAAKLAKCGINILDDSAAVVRLGLIYLGRNPDAASAEDLAAVDGLLTQIRPFVRTIDSANYIEALANGDLCIALSYNGDVVQARNRAREARNGIDIRYVIPNEGSLMWFTMLAIPRDARHVANAHRFINYLTDARVSAHMSNTTGFANPNAAALPFLDSSLAADTAVYPTPGELQRLVPQMQDSPERARAVTRLWQKFKTGL